MRKGLILSFLIICMAGILAAGCTNTASTNAPLTPPPEIIYVTVTLRTGRNGSRDLANPAGHPGPLPRNKWDPGSRSDPSPLDSSVWRSNCAPVERL